MLACERKHCPVRAELLALCKSRPCLRRVLQPRCAERLRSIPAAAKCGGMNNSGRAARAPKKMISVSARRVATWQSTFAEPCYACSIEWFARWIAALRSHIRQHVTAQTPPQCFRQRVRARSITSVLPLRLQVNVAHIQPLILRT